MGSIGNVVVNTLVRMFTRKAVGKATKSTSSGKGKRDGGRKGRPSNRSAKDKKDND